MHDQRKAEMKLPAVICAFLLWLIAAAACVLALLVLLYAEHPSLGSAVLLAYVALLALAGGIRCIRESQKSKPSALRSLGMVCLVAFGISVGAAAGAYLDRGSAHGVMGDFVVAFGGMSVFALLFAGLCYVYAPNSTQEDARG